MISVIIPTMNEEKHIGKCISSLANSRHSDYEVIVVDALSRDNTVSIARELGARVINDNDKHGIGHARNLGLKEASGEIVAFLDADSVACDGWLDMVAESFAKGYEVAGGPTYYGKFLYDLYSAFVFVPNNLHPITGFTYISGNNSAYDSGLLKKIGGFNPVVIEDFDLSLKLKNHGAKRHFNRNMKVYLSPRRFEEKGFLNTVGYWASSSVKVALGRGNHGKDYERYDG